MSGYDSDMVLVETVLLFNPFYMYYGVHICW